MDKYGSAHEWPHDSGPLWLHPDDDLAPNRPGEDVHAKLASLEPRERDPGPLRTALARVARRPRAAAAWREQLTGQQRVGDILEELTGTGWRLLHSLPLPSHTVIAHLLIGPGGVFTVRTEHHRRARVRVGPDAAQLGRRRGSVPCVRLARREALAASLALERRCGFAVTAQPVLVFVAARALTCTDPSGTVLVLREGEIADRLGRTGGVWKPAEIETVYALARDRRTWTRL
ncbi:nuclease-related domain-containing protein [Streptomyces iconiensis]|uniref:Nuclease-related domain-containing protein n=1 Tax=Streptomyces iconiensis TaxID=1384038 RepID=A0ABT6ZVR4_9ACTN|nr:nuclease-related domain-containing protein [Streptomyces iconiensis]MDJ1132912.1 nuclease-related domain-containing protein [Streptomyces iconiensis]